MKRIILTSVMLLMLCNLASAEDSPALMWDGGVYALLVSRETFAIEVNDLVKDGCLPYPEKLKDKLEISLRKNGFGIDSVSFGKLGDEIRIVATGSKLDDESCAVYIAANLVLPALVTVPYAQNVPGGSETIIPYKYFLGGRLLTGPRYLMQSRLEQFVSEKGDLLFLKISRAKDRIFPKFPSIKEELMKMRSSQ